LGDLGALHQRKRVWVQTDEMDAERLPPDLLLAALLAAMESAGLGCTVVVNDGGELRREYSNTPAAKILGMTVEELQRTPPLAVTTKEETERLSKMRASGSGGSRNFETKVARADGSVVPVEVSMGSVPLGEGERSAIVAFLRDVTPRVAMENALRESEERLRTIAEACPDSITMVCENRYVYANPVAMRLLGVTSQEELARIDAIGTVPKEYGDELRERHQRLLAGEVIPPTEVRRKVGGRDVVLEVSSRPTTFGGRPAIVSYARDITERKELQARLMQQDRLAAVGTLAAGLAHELNNPLSYLAFHIKKLRELPLEHASGEKVDALTQIEEGTQRMQSVISDLLFLTRDSDRPLAHVDLRQILLSTLSLVKAGAGTKADITSELATTSSMLGHPSRLGQVFLNVILNALEAVAEREAGRVRVELREIGPWLEVLVTDNGPGVADEHKSRIFDPFFTTKPEGTGLGLSISHAIVTAHGGEISLENIGGEGAVVTIRLPTASTHAQ
jgi:PAS domain S-box-containing protein